MTTQSQEIRQKIWALPTNARRKDVIELARLLEYVSLTFTTLPDDLFSIYVDVFSDPALCSRMGVSEFVSGIFNDFHKFSEEQKGVLLMIFLENGHAFSVPILRTAVADFIARKYVAEVALDTFSKMWGTANQHLRDIAYTGAQVLSLLIPNKGNDRDELRKFGELMSNTVKQV